MWSVVSLERSTLLACISASTPIWTLRVVPFDCNRQKLSNELSSSRKNCIDPVALCCANQTSGRFWFRTHVTSRFKEIQERAFVHASDTLSSKLFEVLSKHAKFLPSVWLVMTQRVATLWISFSRRRAPTVTVGTPLSPHCLRVGGEIYEIASGCLHRPIRPVIVGPFS